MDHSTFSSRVDMQWCFPWHNFFLCTYNKTKSQRKLHSLFLSLLTVYLHFAIFPVHGCWVQAVGSGRDASLRSHPCMLEQRLPASTIHVLLELLAPWVCIHYWSCFLHCSCFINSKMTSWLHCWVVPAGLVVVAHLICCMKKLHCHFDSWKSQVELY